MSELNDWFEINLGWFFINGRKQEEWAEYINTKKLKQDERKRMVLDERKVQTF